MFKEEVADWLNEICVIYAVDTTPRAIVVASLIIAIAIIINGLLSGRG